MASVRSSRQDWDSAMHMIPLRRQPYERASSSAYEASSRSQSLDFESSDDLVSNTYEAYDAHATPKLGRTEGTRVLNRSDSAALLISLCGIGGAFATVQVHAVALSLKLQNQLNNIGLMLSTMNLRLMASLPTLLLRCEAALGKSTIQDFEAIFINQACRSHVDWRWRNTICFLAALPLGLCGSHSGCTLCWVYSQL
jgi:hypothetical protein